MEGVLTPDSRVKADGAEKLWVTSLWMMKTDSKDESTFLLFKKI